MQLSSHILQARLRPPAQSPRLSSTLTSHALKVDHLLRLNNRDCPQAPLIRFTLLLDLLAPPTLFRDPLVQLLLPPELRLVPRLQFQHLLPLRRAIKISNEI